MDLLVIVGCFQQFGHLLIMSSWRGSSQLAFLTSGRETAVFEMIKLVAKTYACSLEMTQLLWECEQWQSYIVDNFMCMCELLCDCLSHTLKVLFILTTLYRCCHPQVAERMLCNMSASGLRCRKNIQDHLCLLAGWLWNTWCLYFSDSYPCYRTLWDACYN